jgi:hypothetical protein
MVGLIDMVSLEICDSLLLKLLSGEIKVKDAEKFVEVKI